MSVVVAARGDSLIVRDAIGRDVRACGAPTTSTASPPAAADLIPFHFSH